MVSFSRCDTLIPARMLKAVDAEDFNCEASGPRWLVRLRMIHYARSSAGMIDDFAALLFERLHPLFDRRHRSGGVHAERAQRELRHVEQVVQLCIRELHQQISEKCPSRL